MGGVSRLRPSRRGTRRVAGPPRTSEVVDHRHVGAPIEAIRREQRGAEVTGPQRVAAAAPSRPPALDLAERVIGELSRPREPALVAGSPERA